MINLYQNYSLKEYNTFNIEAKAKYFLEFDNLLELEEVLKNSNISESNFFILGGGSNVLFTENFNGVILHPKFQGISIIDENDNFAFVKVGANEEWDNFVEYAVNNNLGGIENLSKIPGTVGSSPVQNIGAYGAEVKDVIDKVEAFNITTYNSGFFTNEQCEFQYRSSVFKTKYKNNYIITSVIFKLSKKHNLNINYKDLQSEIGEKQTITISDVRNAIIKIRENNSQTQFPNAKCTLHLLDSVWPMGLHLILYSGKKSWKWNKRIPVKISFWDLTRLIYFNCRPTGFSVKMEATGK